VHACLEVVVVAALLISLVVLTPLPPLLLPGVCIVGKRYGLIGPNGSGKSTFLRAIGRRDVPIPSHIDIHLLDGEVEASDLTPIQCVMALREREVAQLEREADLILQTEEGAESERLQQIYERLYDELDLEKATPRAAEILHGLGFTAEMQRKAAREFSGGWRMVCTYCCNHSHSAERFRASSSTA
jgi:ATPase subunit of ABC transporter with duplicated ATPase domains